MKGTDSGCSWNPFWVKRLNGANDMGYGAVEGF